MNYANLLSADKYTADLKYPDRKYIILLSTQGNHNATFNILQPEELSYIDMRLGQNGSNNVKLDGMYFSMIDSANGELYRFYNEEQMALVYKGSKKCKL